MNKKFLLLSVLSVLVLAGCNNGQNNNPTSETTPSTSIVDSSSTSEVTTTPTTSNGEVTTPTTSEVTPTTSEVTPSTSEVTPTPSTTVTPDPTTPVVNLVAADGLALAIANKAKVASGTLEITGGWNTNNYTYEFGEDDYGAFTRVVQTSTFSTSEYIYGYDSNGDLYGVSNSGYGWNTVSGVTADYLEGPSYTSISYSMPIYGANGWLNFLSSTISANKNLDFVDLSTDTEYKFSVGYLLDGWSKALYIFEVSFALDDGALSSLVVKNSKYTAITADFENSEVYYVNDGATAESVETLTFTQVVGEKTATNDKNIETFYFTSFDLTEADGSSLPATLQVVKGTSYNLKPANVAPSNASFTIDKPVLTIVEGEANGVSCSYNSSNGVLAINGSVAGDYVITISTKNVSKTLSLTVSLPAPTSASVSGYYTRGDSNASVVVGDTMTTYVGSTVHFIASFLPYDADQAYTATIDNENLGTLTFVNDFLPNPDMATNIKQAYKFVATAAGTVNITFASSIDSTVLQTVTVTVLDAPTLASLAGRYVKVESGTISQDVTISNIEGNNGTITYVSSTTTSDLSFTYDPDTKSFTLFDSNGEVVSGMGLYFDELYTLVLVKETSYGDYVYEQEIVLSVYDPALLLIGFEWSYKINDLETVAISFYEGGTGSFSYTKKTAGSLWNYDVSLYKSISYTLNSDNGYSFILDATSVDDICSNEHIDSISSVITFDATSNSLSLTISIDGTSYECALTKASM